MTLSGISLDAGIHFFQEISGKTENDRWFWQFGATQIFQTQIAAKRDFYAYTFLYNYSVQEISKDTTDYFEDQIGTISMPDKFSIGASIGRNKQDKNVWTLGIQYNIYNWDLYKEVFEDVNVNINDHKGNFITE